MAFKLFFLLFLAAIGLSGLWTFSSLRQIDLPVHEDWKTDILASPQDFSDLAQGEAL